MVKQRNPNGSGNYVKRKDGRIRWRIKKDGRSRDIYGRNSDELNQKKKKVADLPITATTKTTVEEWFELWLGVYIKPLKSGAYYNQQNDLYKVHIKPVIGYRKISGLSSVDIQGVISSMNTKVRKEAVKDDKGNIIKPALIGYSTKTMKETKGVMKRAFEQAIEDKIINESPLGKITIPKKQAKVRKVLPVHEISKLFKAMENSRWIWAMKLLLVTGLRRGELLALKDIDIEIDKKRLAIDESDGPEGIKDTKSAKIHYVPLSNFALQYLAGQHEMLRKEFNPVLHSDTLKESKLLFPSENGTLLRGDSFTKMVKRFADKAGVKASPHCLRHTFVYLSRKTFSLKELQQILGHDESTTTWDIYGDIIDDSCAETAKSIDDIFNKVNEELEKIEAEKANDKEKKMGKVIQFPQRA